MKKITFTLLISSLASFGILAQKGFDKKKRTSEGTAPTENFEKINASKRNQTLNFSTNSDFHKKILEDPETASVYYVEAPAYNREIKNAKKSAQLSAVDFISSVKADLKLKNPKEEFLLINDHADELGMHHVKLQQTYKNIPVYNAESIVHTDKNGKTNYLNGRIYPSFEINTTPSINKAQAIENALTDLKLISIVQKVGAIGKMLNLDPDAAELIILPINKSKKLAYEVKVRPNLIERWVYFIDALDGKVLDKYNHTCSVDGIVSATARDLNSMTRTFNISQIGTGFYLIDHSKKMYNPAKSKLPDNPVGTIWTINAQNSKYNDENLNLDHVKSTSKNVWAETAVSAHYNASLSYDYYLSKFNRNSLNGSGGNLISVINLADEDGKGFDQAFWNGAIMGYGNGRTSFKPLAGGLDVAGHEMTHGVIENSAKLEYRSQPGALSESFADIFGTLIDREDYLIGEDVVLRSAYPSGALRSLENPNQGGRNDPGYQPKTMAQYVNLAETPEQNNGGVHVNSGIPNHAYYKFVTGSGMSKEKAERVYYRALTNYLTRASNFADLRIAVLQSAKDLYGDATEAAAARAAFDFVGIKDATNGGGGGTPTTPADNNIPVNPGMESLVVFDPRSVDQSLYAGAYPSQVELSKITNALGCLAKPSVTDDGSFVYFVGKDKKIYRRDLTKNTAATTVSTEAVWRNVAISKNGKVLAALTSVLDDFIYIFDLVKGTGKKIQLFNPTYTEGIKTGEVLYADSFEWDYSGQYLIYDAFNKAKSTFKDIEYWDVGILRAWDPAKNTFGDGSIEKMFTNLDEGDNIGNPALAKTNSKIYAFDYFSAGEDTYNIIGIDFGKATNNVGLIAGKNTDVGYPDYSKSDKSVVYNGTVDGVSVVNSVSLAADKISGSGTPREIFTDAKWAVWYAVGQRALPTKQTQEILIAAVPDKPVAAKFDIVATTNSGLVLEYTVVSGDASINGKTVSLGTKPGKIVLAVSNGGNAQFSNAVAQVSFCMNPNSPTLTENNTDIIASGTAPYQFYINGNPIGGQTNSNTFRKDIAGAYTVKSLTTDGCFSGFSNALTVKTLALGSEPNVSELLKISPNPAEDFVQIQTPENMVLKSVNVYDQSGKQILVSKQDKINIKNWSSGTYIVNVETDQKILSAKFIKK